MEMTVAPSITLIDRCIEVLQRTQDGNQLSPSDLALVQGMVNANGRPIREAAQAAFETLYAQVTAGTYVKQWFHGFDNLTRDHTGYVYWRGKMVEHYSFDNELRERAAAEKLAARCRSLEERGIPVNGNTVLSPLFTAMPADCPYMPLLARLYAVFGDAVGNPTCVIVNLPEYRARVLAYDGDAIKAQDFDSAYDAYHGCGYTKSLHAQLNEYHSAIRVLQRGRFIPEAVAPFLP